MLILQRKPGEELVIGENITVSVISVEGNRVRLAITAPREVSILRRELLDAGEANRESAAEQSTPEELMSLLGSLSAPLEEE